MSVSWAITKNTATNVVRYEISNVLTLDLTQIQEGDYVNVYGSGFDESNQGSFEIINVEIYYVGPNLIQAFEIVNQYGTAETATQGSNDEVQFFRPTIERIQSGARTVVVSSTEDGLLDVSIPATTEAVSRGLLTGSYVHQNSSIAATNVSRDSEGLVTVNYSATPAPSLSVGDFISLENIQNTPPDIYKSPGILTTMGAPNANSTSDASLSDIVSVLFAKTSGIGADGQFNTRLIKGINGDALSIGGYTFVGSTIPVNNDQIQRFTSVSSALVTDGTLASGANRYTYHLNNPNTTFEVGEQMGVANITAGGAINKILIHGGLNSLQTNGVYGAYEATDYTTIYDPVANSVVLGDYSGYPNGAHTLTTLLDGRILAYGGAQSYNSGAYIENVNAKAGFLWDPGTQTWPTGGAESINTEYRRAAHRTVVLDNGHLLFIGGLAGAIPHGLDDKTLAYWPMDDVLAGPVTDETGNYSLTAVGSTSVDAAKISRGREFFDSSHAAGAGDSAAVTALLGDWTVEWWSCGAVNSVPATYPLNMELSGLGSGTIVAYGGLSSETEANNTLMHVSITGGNLVWRWENGAGVDVTGSAAIVGAVTDVYNHFAVRKKFNGTNYDVTLFVNGAVIGQNLGVANASGGSTSTWHIARNPDTAAVGFTGVIDDLRVSNVARTDGDILLNFWGGSASIPRGAGTHRIGMLHHYVDLWDPTTTPVTVGSMSLGRAYHTATKLPNGHVLVTGGLAQEPSNFMKALGDAGPTTLYGPTKSTNLTEIYNPTTQSWYNGPQTLIRRHNHSAVYIPDRNIVLLVGGESTEGDDCKVIEYIDINTMQIGRLSEKLTYDCKQAILLDNGTVYCSTEQIDDLDYSINAHQLIQFGTKQTGTKGLNDYHKITTVGSGFFKFQSEAQQLYTNYGKPDNTTTWVITGAERASNVTTVTFATSGHQFQVNDYVYVNYDFAGGGFFSSGLKLVTAVGADDISYDDVASNQAYTAVTGAVYKNYSPEASFYSWLAQSDSIPGPYVFDPVDGVAITDTTTTIGGSLFAGLFKGQKYTILPVVDSTVFPDEEGFVVLGFGTELQTKPIRYYGRYNPYGLLLDYTYQFKDDIPTGTEVVLLFQRGPYIPNSLVGGLYATSSSAGRVAAQKTIQDIASAGIKLDVTVVYPGDRGLGGEGLPTKGETKLSDKTTVWAGDDVDGEIAKLKE